MNGGRTALVVLVSLLVLFVVGMTLYLVIAALLANGGNKCANPPKLPVGVPVRIVTTGPSGETMILEFNPNRYSTEQKDIVAGEVDVLESQWAKMPGDGRDIWVVQMVLDEQGNFTGWNNIFNAYTASCLDMTHNDTMLDMDVWKCDDAKTSPEHTSRWMPVQLDASASGFALANVEQDGTRNYIRPGRVLDVSPALRMDFDIQTADVVESSPDLRSKFSVWRAVAA